MNLFCALNGKSIYYKYYYYYYDPWQERYHLQKNSITINIIEGAKKGEGEENTIYKVYFE